ncbi:unnamed protein product [Orchesella dallaii]|uniref:Uncharacterized protein n=1 Tax=Orchesella dallaii TaxID=48710 RepID=A0ABP1R251_9HEXA
MNCYYRENYKLGQQTKRKWQESEHVQNPKKPKTCKVKMPIPRSTSSSSPTPRSSPSSPTQYSSSSSPTPRSSPSSPAPISTPSLASPLSTPRSSKLSTAN